MRHRSDDCPERGPILAPAKCPSNKSHSHVGVVAVQVATRKIRPAQDSNGRMQCSSWFVGSQAGCCDGGRGGSRVECLLVSRCLRRCCWRLTTPLLGGPRPAPCPGPRCFPCCNTRVRPAGWAGLRCCLARTCHQRSARSLACAPSVHACCPGSSSQLVARTSRRS